MRGVLLIPGFNGTFLIDRAYPKRNIACKTTIRNASTYIDFDLFMGLTEKEWIKRMKMHWFEDEKKLKGNKDIVTLLEYDEGINPIDAVSNLSQELFLGDETINSLSMNNLWCLNKKTGYKYFHTIAQSLTSMGCEVKALPYDFRRIGDQDYMEDLSDRMIQEIESFHPDSLPVILVGHSMGGLLARDFIARKCPDEEWCKEHIHSGISLGAPFAGVPSIYNSIIPDAVKSSWQEKAYAQVAMTLGGIALCSSELIMKYKYNSNTVLVLDHEEIDEIIGFPLLRMKKTLFQDMIDGIEIPTPVPFHRIIGKNVPTQNIVAIRDKECHIDLDFLPGDGDGLVPIQSAIAGNPWMDGNVIMLDNVRHSFLVQDDNVIKMIKKMVLL